MLSRQQQIHIFVLVYLFIGAVLSSDVCPPSCICGVYSGTYSVNCERRNLRHFPTEIDNRTQLLRFSHNQITELPRNLSVMMPHLTDINFNNNNLTHLPDGIFSNLTSLKFLKLSENKIESIGNDVLRNTPNVLLLSLSDNKISIISEHFLRGANGAMMVYLDGNSLTNLHSTTFQGAMKLGYISLAKNSLTSIKDRLFSNLPHLYHLDLSHNKITSLPSTTFRGSDGLESIILTNNKIQTLPQQLLQRMPKLTNLNLANNNFTRIPNTALNILPSITKIKIEENPLLCDCQLRFGIERPESRITLADIASSICSSSAKNVSATFKELNCVTTPLPTKETTPVSLVTEAVTPPGPFDKEKVNKGTPAMSTPLIVAFSVIGSLILIIAIVFIFVCRAPIFQGFARLRGSPSKTLTRTYSSYSQVASQTRGIPSDTQTVARKLNPPLSYISITPHVTEQSDA